MKSPKLLNYITLIVLILVSSSCARHEGFHDCKAYPEPDVDQIIQITQNNLEKDSPLTKQQGLQILMGTQGVLDCEFTGL